MRELDSQDPFQLCGTTIEGKYRITSVVGDGGFGVVYRAVHQGFDEPVAVKCLKLPGRMSSKERELLLSQLREEGRLLLRLSRATSGIVQALDVGAFTTAEGLWVPYLILEWLEGETLAQYVRRRFDRGEGPLSVAEAASLLEPAARALAVAHAQKVAHRDVKPQNLFFTQVGSSRTLKVLDFGIAKVIADHPTFTQALAATNLGPTAFTPRYGAPEQFNKKRGATGPWTDVFALALIVVELASGKQALEGDDPTELYIASADPSIRPTLRGRGARAPEAVERVLAKALSVEPKHRYTDAGEFWDALSAAIVEAGADARIVNGGEAGEIAVSGATQAMLGTAEFAAARKLDVSSTGAPEAALAKTEAAVIVAPTLPMTVAGAGGALGPKIAPTIPAEPLSVDRSGASQAAPGSEPAAFATGAPSSAASGSSFEGSRAPADAAGRPADASTKPSEMSGRSADAPGKPAEAIPESPAAPAPSSAATSKARPRTSGLRTDDPMAETPPVHRPPLVSARPKGQSPHSTSDAPTTPKAAAAAVEPTPDIAPKTPSAGPPEKRSWWMWAAGGLAAVALAGGVVFAMSGEPSTQQGGPAKGAASAGAKAPKPKASGKMAAPVPSAPASAASAASEASAASAAAPIIPPADMVYIPPGAATMGAGPSAREVTLSRGFFIDRNEVTVHAYQACMARRMCSAADHVIIPAAQEGAGIEGVSSSKEFAETWSRRCNEPRKALDHPVNCVDYSNAESYCRFRNKRLPTEAEWERAARGTEGRLYPWGNEEPDCGRACFERNGECLASGESVTTCTAGSRPNDKTPEAIYDLGGNVAEWVADGWSAAPRERERESVDPQGDPTAAFRVVRGASFLDSKEKLLASYRVGAMPGMSHVSIGFRCAMDAPSPTGPGPVPSDIPKGAAAPPAKAGAPPRSP